MLGGGCSGLFGIIWFVIVMFLSTATPRLSVWVGWLKVSSQSKISNDSRHVLYNNMVQFLTKENIDMSNNNIIQWWQNVRVGA